MSHSRRVKTSKLPFLLSLTILAATVGAYFVVPGFHVWINEAFEVLTSQDPAQIRLWVARFGAWGPIVIIVVMVLQMFLFVVPNILLILITVLSYGPLWGSLLALLANFISSSVGYFIGRRLSRVIIDRLVSPQTQQRLREFLRDYGVKAVIALRLSTFSNDGLSLVAGLLKMKYRRFITASMIGITPLIGVLAIFGHNGRIERGIIVIGVAMLAVLVIYIVIDRRKRQRVEEAVAKAEKKSSKTSAHPTKKPYQSQSDI